MATLRLILFSCAALLSTVLAQSWTTYPTTSSGSSCAYRNYYSYNGNSYTAYRYCSYKCCGYYYYRYCCYSYNSYYYDYSYYYNVYYYKLSPLAIAGIVIGGLTGVACIIGIVVCIICVCRAKPINSGTILRQNQAATAVTVASVQTGGRPGLVYPVQSYPISPQPYYVLPATGSAFINQPVNPPPYQPMTGGVTNTAFTSGAVATGAESKVSAPPAYSQVTG